MEATKTRATISAKHHTNNAATQYTIRANRKIIGTIWSPCEVWNNSHSDEYQITVNVAPGYALNSHAPTLEKAIAEFDRLTDGKYNIDTKGIPATPSETPQIVRVEIVRDFDKSYYANLYDENGGSHNLSKEYTDFRTLKTLCKKEYGVNLPNLSQIEFETYGRKSYAYINTETPQISTETAETVNVSAEGETAAERAENKLKPTVAEVVQIVKTELAKNKAMRTAWHLEFPDGIESNTSHKCTIAGCDFYEYTEARNGEEVFKDYTATERDITLYICQRLELDALDPPQPPETPQTVECIAEHCKLAQTA